ncbi:LysR family transcriptional regulator [Streptomyces sp. NBC_01283]|uniref:LysR family transcriptional regulator n=1 Tax=Streptomyces sp. NBC_01283 TaxID=2903812 RepID=UPI00352DDEDA|nr:LysR family transcriptional regulator [Streptomyces sp. NBC_01283]
MELRQLEYFVAVADEGGFGRAAVRLHVVQASVSQQVARLERELGLRLFDRTTRRVGLTAAGERLLPEARAALAAAARVGHVAAEMLAAGEGILRLGTTRAFAERVYPALDVLAEHVPGLRVRLVQEARERRIGALRSGELDAALVRGGGPLPGLEMLTVWDDPLIVALPANHPLAAMPRLEPADLAGLPLRLAPRERNPAFHDLVTGLLRTSGIDMPAGPHFTTLQETLAAIATDSDCSMRGAASWTVFDLVGDLPPARRIAFRALLGARSPVSLAVRPGPLSPAIRHLLNALGATRARAQ